MEQSGKSNKRKQLAFEDKESYRWYEAMSEVNELLGNGVRKIHIADREADIPACRQAGTSYFFMPANRTQIC